MIPGNSRDYKPQISHSLPVEFSNSHSLPDKREWDFQFPFPFPGAKKPFPLTPVLLEQGQGRVKFDSGMSVG